MTALFAGACGLLVLGTITAVKDASKKDSGPWRDKHAELWTLILLFVAAVIGLSEPGRFYPHYYIQAVPILCLFSAPIYASAWSGKRVYSFWPLNSKPSRIWLALTALAFFISHAIGVKQACGDSPVGEYLLSHSRSTDTLFVWGQSANLYLDAQRRAATRYIATFPLTGYIFGSPLSWDPSFDTTDRIVPGAWEKLKSDFTRALPDYIVDCDAARTVPRYPLSRFPYLKAIVENCYELQLRTVGGDIYRRKPGLCPQVAYAVP